jgi:hypothetical protein
VNLGGKQRSAPESRVNDGGVWPIDSQKSDPLKIVAFAEQQFRDLKTEIVQAQRAVEAPVEPNFGIRDAPETILDGRLGDIYQKRLRDFPVGLGYFALLAAGAALVRPGSGPIRTNLFVAQVGKVGCGKTQSSERANYLMDVKPPLLLPLKAGSVEGLLAQIGDRTGHSILFAPEELSHTLEKMMIPNNCFAQVLNSIFYRDAEDLVVAAGKKVSFNCRLSIIGGIPEDKFEESFGSASTGGLYSRFLFGLSPTDFVYDYHPLEGPPAFTDQLEECRVNGDVWESLAAISKNEQIDRRVLEISLRVAAICAALDGRDELRALDLEPAWELARYQSRIRGLLKPNGGRTFEGILAHKFLTHLARFEGRFVGRRDLMKATRAYDYGLSIADRALDTLICNGDVAKTTVGKKELVKLVTHDDENRELLDSIAGAIE